ncbi:hypothetical protein KQX54_002231 [Cotesia glomerata]|uniref:Uncharacterized protein n=1 Tax=Cotesia glomerata TaxID=32391 RepID=A0AAV7II80_COTGL|nr:hypothetical protein KQX54_002231 [Cotesia glomerata]
MGWKLNSCCCCFELKTGVVVIGILGLNQPALIFPAIIVSIIGLILYLGLIWAGSIVAFKNDVAEVGIVMLIVGHLVWG